MESISFWTLTSVYAEYVISSSRAATNSCTADVLIKHQLISAIKRISFFVCRGINVSATCCHFPRERSAYISRLFHSRT